ncbi:unnamed protein product [Lymnaea stagnalis]|uniref:Uncharacterized protein n=1 Tax=Lymnaea stagnalis TaxID=6523 RepID=A0AAV2H284_LYMST
MIPAISRVALTVLLLHTLSTVGAYEDLTSKEKNFLSALNGYFTNTKQILEEVQSKSENIHPFSSVLFVPYKVPALPERPTVFFEQRFVDSVYRRTVAYVSEDDQGRVILELFDIPIAENDVPGSYGLENLNNLKPEDLSSRPECSVVFTEVSELKFDGHWPDCSRDFAGARPYYNATLTCRSLIAATHSEARENSAGAAYVQILETEKFPSPYYDNSDDPCAKSN